MQLVFYPQCGRCSTCLWINERHTSPANAQNHWVIISPSLLHTVSSSRALRTNIRKGEFPSKAQASLVPSLLTVSQSSSYLLSLRCTLSHRKGSLTQSVFFPHCYLQVTLQIWQILLPPILWHPKYCPWVPSFHLKRPDSLIGSCFCRGEK